FEVVKGHSPGPLINNSTTIHITTAYIMSQVFKSGLQRSLRASSLRVPSSTTYKLQSTRSCGSCAAVAYHLNSKKASRSFSATATSKMASVQEINPADAKNLSFVLQKPYDVKFEDRPIPQIRDPYDVIVNVKYTGICGSDVHYWTDGAIGDFVVKAPMVLGHESAGIVEEVGDKVTTLKKGDRVTMEPGVPCRRCPRCREGKYNLCVDMAFAATPPYDGTLAKYYRLPEDFCYKVADHVPLEEAALVEPLSVGVHITKQADIKPGQSVVVFGAGPVGLLCMAVAKSFGATKIVAVDINEERLEFAQKYAATHVFRSQRVSAQENAKLLTDECDLGLGADAIIDATGAEPCIQTAIQALRTGGTYVQGGMGKPDINWPIMAMCAKELNVKGSFRYGPGDYQLAVDLITSGSLSVKELITGRVKFEDAEQAFKDVHAAKGIKMIIEGPQ
ncbi:GroES-like protein, partial [Aureobasidium melanogenum]